MKTSPWRWHMASMGLPLTSGVTIGKRRESRTHTMRLEKPNSSCSSLLTWRTSLASALRSSLTLFSHRVIPCGSHADAERIRKYVTDYQSHPNQMKVDDRIVVSTFAGESCRFGANDLNQGWSETLKSADMPPVLPLTPLSLSPVLRIAS